MLPIKTNAKATTRTELPESCLKKYLLIKIIKAPTNKVKTPEAKLNGHKIPVNIPAHHLNEYTFSKDTPHRNIKENKSNR
jgi:hypothetical protein